MAGQLQLPLLSTHAQLQRLQAMQEVLQAAKAQHGVPQLQLPSRQPVPVMLPHHRPGPALGSRRSSWKTTPLP